MVTVFQINYIDTVVQLKALNKLVLFTNKKKMLFSSTWPNPFFLLDWGLDHFLVSFSSQGVLDKDPTVWPKNLIVIMTSAKSKMFFKLKSSTLTGEKTLHVVAVASNGNLKRWDNFY
jgi:hypothetical protein